MTQTIDNKYFNFSKGIITVKISSDMSQRTMEEVYKIEHLFEEIIPACCYIAVNDNIMYFCDPYDDYPIDENFDTTIY
jgi:hypothetical protein